MNRRRSNVKELTNFETALKAFGVTLPGTPLPHTEVVKNLIEGEIEDLNRTRTDHPDDWEDEYEGERLRELESGEITTIDHMLNYFRNASYDLWSAAMIIPPSCFKEG